jgi:hypothetical protein
MSLLGATDHLMKTSNKRLGDGQRFRRKVQDELVTGELGIKQVADMGTSFGHLVLPRKRFRRHA